MHALLSAAGRSFLRAFVASIIVLGVGILAAPSIHSAYLLGVAALLASVAAGIRALQAYVPQLSLQAYIPKPWGDYTDAFLRAFLASLVVTLPGVLGAPDLATGRSLGVAAIIGAATAGLRVLQGFFQKGEGPAGGRGVPAPENP